ncbi:hypothetical protein SK128_009773 [Halocaridina rubra]|uniref:Broad-complex n=1 Tax=Halocaridina rubra TaxID=373956 RepID=A0AAN8XFA5_HALRR
MGADQQFCLRWNNFHSNITSAFESLRDDEDFVDITLACDGRQIKAHKMVLSACSPYFRSLLKGNPCQHPIVFLKDVTFSNLTSILDFMYHGEVNVSHNELATFLKTAEALKVRGLAEDEKKKDSENYNESSSPPPPRDPPDPGSPRLEEGSSAPDTHLSDSPPPKRQRRRSGNSVHSTEDTNETVLSDQQVRDTSVKNEPQDFNEEEDLLSQSVDQDIVKSDLGDEDRSFGPTESVSISRSQAMQQLQESFGSFLPGMGQSPGFLPHGATDMSRPPPYSLEGVQGSSPDHNRPSESHSAPKNSLNFSRAHFDYSLPPGISALPGPSMSQGAASQDASQGARAWVMVGGVDGGVGGGGMVGVVGGGGMSVSCPVCNKRLSNKYNLRIHIRDKHETQEGCRPTCTTCRRTFKNANSLRVHSIKQHGHLSSRRRLRAAAAAAAAAAAMYRHHHSSYSALNSALTSMHPPSNALNNHQSSANVFSSDHSSQYHETTYPLTSSSSTPSLNSISERRRRETFEHAFNNRRLSLEEENEVAEDEVNALLSSLNVAGGGGGGGQQLHLTHQATTHATSTSATTHTLTSSPFGGGSHLQVEEPSPRLTSPAFRE